MRQKLYAFDLDDTLIRSESKVELYRDGQHIELTPAEFAQYVKQEGDVLDFKQFQDIIGEFDKIAIKPMLEYFTEKLQESLINPNIHVGIVTARQQVNFQSVLDFFDFYFRYMEGISHQMTQKLLSHIEFKGLNSSDPEAKKEYVEGYITGEKVNQPGIDEVHFFDDSLRNVKAVYSLSIEYPHTKIFTYLVERGKAILYNPFGRQ